MRAARLHAAGEPLRIETVPLPEPKGTQVRVRVAGCGVCHTDLHIARGEVTRVELPLTLGHEVGGWIDTAGSEATDALDQVGLASGDAVLVFGGWGCGACTDCLAGEEQRCPTGRSPGFQLDGGYAEALLVQHPRHLVALGDLDPVRAAPLADAGVTPYRAVRRAEPWFEPGARVAVIGAGGLGQFAIQYLRGRPNLRMVVAEPNPERSVLALKLGADAVIAAAEPGSVRDALGGAPDVIFDFVGSAATLAQASAAVASDGLVMLVGEAGGRLAFGFNAQPETWLTTTVWGSLADLRAVVELASRGAIDWSVETMPLPDAQRALDRLAGGTVAGRLVLVPGRTK
ncbi:MAG TPA: alcohol dehydrogenase catalytic domain-containing protein [Candidatus Limnocylindria bacterium]|nr:alcohol dehydrogenase catalytic domain-containing protein [Candidatus Limnocylindria bacterium]